MNKKLLGIILIVVLAASLCGIVSADILPAPPTLKLTVEMSPLAVYPPYTIYTAQLSYMPPVNSTILMASFYNSTMISPVNTELIGTVPFDKTGKAVISKQIKAGTYTAYAKTAINGSIILSNQVVYRIP